MTDEDGVHKLFFVLSSQSRLDILRTLNNENLRMQEIARRLDLTATEASRQLDRMGAAELIQRRSDGSYSITNYGRLQLHLSSPIEFVLTHRDFFLTHDPWQLPPEFICRIGEISRASLKMGLVESTMKSSKLIGEAKEFLWAISPEPLPIPLETIAGQIPDGVKYRFLSPQPPVALPSLENRSLTDCPVVMAITEKEASLLFRFTDGRVDYAGFIGDDPDFLKWTMDLFMYYWERAGR